MLANNTRAWEFAGAAAGQAPASLETVIGILLGWRRQAAEHRVRQLGADRLAAIDADEVAAAVLGAVQRLVGVRQHAAHHVSGQRGVGDAEAGRQREALPALGR